MLKKPNFENVPNDNPETATPLSKTQIKQQMLAIRDLGKTLCQMPFERLKKSPLSEKVLLEISEYHRCQSFGAQKRQIGYIGKLLRHEDVAEVQAWIQGVSIPQKLQTLTMHAAEQWRDTLVENPKTLDDLIASYPEAVTLDLNPIIRQAQQERKLQKSPKNYRQLYKLIYSLINNANSSEGDA